MAQRQARKVNTYHAPSNIFASDYFSCPWQADNLKDQWSVPCS
jgi:hypothetical protein